MTVEADTTLETNSQTTTDPSALKDDAPAPVSSDTNSSTTEQSESEKPAADADGSILDPKPDAEKIDDALPANAELFGAPEGDYAPTMPEGVTLDADALAAIVPLAKELNLSDAGMTKLAGVYAETVLPGVVSRIEQQMLDNVATLRTDWATDARASVEGGKNAVGEDVTADPVFNGNKLPAVQATAARALDRFGGTEFREFLADNGLGNHPAMLRFAYQAGALISEDTSFERGGGAPVVPKTREEKYYGTSTAA